VRARTPEKERETHTHRVIKKERRNNGESAREVGRGKESERARGQEVRAGGGRETERHIERTKKKSEKEIEHMRVHAETHTQRKLFKRIKCQTLRSCDLEYVLCKRAIQKRRYSAKETCNSDIESDIEVLRSGVWSGFG